MTKRTYNKKIGLVLSSVPGYSETFFSNKIKGLQDSGHEVTLYVDQPVKKNVKLPFKVICNINLQQNFLKIGRAFGRIILKSLFVHSRTTSQLFALERADGLSFKQAIKSLVLNEFLLNEKVDYLHFGFGMLAHNRENVAKALNAEMAVSFRGFDLYLSPLKHPECYNRLFKKQVKYHVLSNEMQQTLVEQAILPDEITVITPAIDVAFFSSEDSYITNTPIQVITVARLHWKKGLEYTLEALAILAKKGIAFHYKIIGDGDEKERLIFAAHQLGILNAVEFAGKLSSIEVKEALTKSDLYLQYSIQEGFCNSVLEA